MFRPARTSHSGPSLTARSVPQRPVLRACGVVLAAICLACSCSMVGKKEKNKTDERATQLQDLQLKVMRFADEYGGRVLSPIRAFQRQTESAQERLAAQNWLVQQTSTAYTIATGPNPVTNALDMVVLTTMSRMALEDGWIEDSFGDRVHALRAVYQTLEPESWKLLEGAVPPDQIQAVHAALDDWRAQNPHGHSVSYVHFRDFVSSPEADRSRSLGGSSLLSLLGLDPLSGLDPTVQEFARTRQSIERAMYFMQRSPQLLDMQVERITYQLAVMPEARSLLTDLDRTSRAAESAGKLAEELPEVVAREREAAIRQFMDALQSQQAQMRELLTDMRATLQAGTAASDSVNQTTRALDAFIAGFRKPQDPHQPPGKPFDITEYTATAHELAQASVQLQGLLAQLNASGPGVARLTDGAATQLNGVVDRAYRRLVELVLILVGACLAAVLLYRLVMRRFAGPPRTP